MKYFYSIGLRKRRRVIAAIVALLLPALGAAQGYNVSGTVLDGKDNQSLIGVIVTLINRGDSTKTQSAATDVDGAFTIPNVLTGSYTLRASYVGYATTTRSVDVASANLALGTITMLQAAKGLSGVTITAEQIRAQQLGDTSQFNAGSYKTNPDASAEDLIGKMPGVTNDNGSVKVNGEDVKKILVDGKEFFGDDPNAALKNLPAEIIDKIQIFDKASDQSQFTGFDDGNSQKTINIVTKRGKNTGTFGKVNGGFGTDEKGKDTRYTAGGNINFFNGDQRISIVGLANNVNQQNFSSEDLLGVTSGGSSGRGGGGGGRGRSGGSGGPGGYSGGGDAASNFLVSQQGGITETQSAGINYSDMWGKKLKVTGSYFFNRGDNSNNTTLTRSYIVNNPDSGLVYNEEGSNHSTNVNHRASVRLEWTLDSMNSIILNPRISMQDNKTYRSLYGNTTVGLANLTQSKISNFYSANTSGYNLNNQLTFRHKFQKPGRTISLNVGTSFNEKTGDGSLNSRNEYLQSDTVVNDQQFDLESNGLTVSGNLSYTEPLTKKSQLMVNYAPSYNKNNSDRETYNRKGLEYTDLDTGLSNKYNNTYYYQRGGLGYRYNDQKVNFNASLNAQYATLNGDQTFPYPLTINRSFTDLLPSAMLNYKFSRTENLRFMYRTSTNAPNISQLQNIVDNSNPLLLRTGNPDLRQDYTHNVSVRYGKTSTGKGNGLFLFANAGYVNNYVGNSTIIAVNDTTVRGAFLNRGTQLSLPVNLDGNWNARSFITYAVPIKSIKTNFNLNGGVTYNRIPAIINNLTNFASNYTFNGGIVAGSNISENVDFTLSTNGSYNIVKNTLQAQRDYNYYSQTSSARFNWIFLERAVFNTNLTHTFYSGLGAGYDQQYLLWNASLGYKFLKSKALQADIYAYDILKQNRAISRTITDTYIEDSQTEVLQRYFMLRLTYTIRAFKSGAPPEATGDDEHPGRGGRRPGGRGGMRGGEGGMN
jgi:hypothetical protein